MCNGLPLRSRPALGFRLNPDWTTHLSIAGDRVSLLLKPLFERTGTLRVAAQGHVSTTVFTKGGGGFWPSGAIVSFECQSRFFDLRGSAISFSYFRSRAGIANLSFLLNFTPPWYWPTAAASGNSRIYIYLCFSSPETGQRLCFCLISLSLNTRFFGYTCPVIPY